MVSAKNSLISLEIVGWRDLEKALRDLGDNKEIRRALRKALKNRATMAMVSRARSIAPKRTGRMAEKIDASTTLSRRQRRGRPASGAYGTEAVLYVGAGARGPSIVDEFGTGPRQWKNGKSTGTQPAQPFMRPAWEEFKHAILDEFSKELWVEIEKAAKRIARRQAKLIRESGR